MLIATCSVRRRVMVGGRNCTGRRTRKAKAHRARTHPRVHLTPSVQYKHVHWLSEQCVRCCVPCMAKAASVGPQEAPPTKRA
jgi:hypothetical protein